MPSTKNDTLQRIQQEIKECVQREEELRRGYAQLNNNNNNNNDYDEKPVLQRAQSTSVLSTEVTSNGVRRFAQNPTAKGVMQRFLKSRGRMTISNFNAPASMQNWSSLDVVEPPKVTVEPGKRIRNGYVPVEERMKQELQDFSQRESELRNERRKSQPDLMALIDESCVIEDTPGIRAAKSMAQLYDPEEYPEEISSAPSSLKQARSLADLCDAVDEDLATPGTHYLILQFENLKKQSEQART